MKNPRTAIAFALSLFMAGWCFAVPRAVATDLGLVTHKDLQAVYVDSETGYCDGSSKWAVEHTSDTYTIELVGVVINDPSNMLDTSSTWQVFVQALANAGTYTYGGTTYNVAAGDFGGTAAYLSKYYKKTGESYLDSEWSSLMTQLAGIDRGDIVVIQANAPGMFYNGKFNINEKHHTSSAYDFTITAVGHVDTLTDAITIPTITLADLTTSSSTSGCIFDTTRATGCEHYQGSLVHIDNLLLTSDVTWVSGVGATATVKQGDLTFTLVIGLDEDFASVDFSLLTTNMFSITAILDQESSNYMSGYRLWLTDAGDLAVPEPGTLAILSTIGAAAVAIAVHRRRKA